MECYNSKGLLIFAFFSILFGQILRLKLFQEHPLSGIPFFRVHPCKNTHILDNLGVSSVKTFE
jgi:hypothetical protein